MTTFNKPLSLKKVPVTVEDLREMRRLAELLSRAIHSSPHCSRQEKLYALTKLATQKKLLDGYIQLELFDDSQLDWS